MIYIISELKSEVLQTEKDLNNTSKIAHINKLSNLVFQEVIKT